MDELARMEKALLAADAAGDIPAAQELSRAMRAMLKEVNPDVDAPTDAATAGAKATAKETGKLDTMAVAAGRSFDQIGAGTRQALSWMRGREDVQPPSEQQGDFAYSFLRKERPFSTAIGEGAPYLATGPMGIPAAAATVAGVEGLKYGTPEERKARAVGGGVSTVAGGLLAKGAGSFLLPVTERAARPGHQSALRAAERIEMHPTMAESTGSSFLRRLEDAAARSPGGGGVMADHAARNQAAVNRAAAKSIGETADELTPEVFANAAKRIGQVFEDVKALPGTPIAVGPKLVTVADDILRQQAKMLPTQQDPALVQLATQAKALAQNKGRIDGETYQLQRSGLSTAAFEAEGTNKALYGKLLEALDDSAEASLRANGNAALADALKTARPQWANLKLLEKGATAEAGQVSPAKVASTMRTNNPGAFRRGSFTGPLRDVAEVGEGLKPLRAGSPTYERDASTSIFNALWSYPFAKVSTSPAATIYPRAMGRAGVSDKASKYLEAPGRAAVAAALAESGLLPFSPAVHQ